MKWVNTEIIRQAATRFGFAATAYHAPYVVGSTESNRDPMLAYSFWKLAVECARANLIWDSLVALVTGKELDLKYQNFKFD